MTRPDPTCPSSRAPSISMFTLCPKSKSLRATIPSAAFCQSAHGRAAGRSGRVEHGRVCPRHLGGPGHPRHARRGRVRRLDHQPLQPRAAQGAAAQAQGQRPRAVDAHLRARGARPRRAQAQPLTALVAANPLQLAAVADEKPARPRCPSASALVHGAHQAAAEKGCRRRQLDPHLGPEARLHPGLGLQGGRGAGVDRRFGPTRSTPSRRTKYHYDSDGEWRPQDELKPRSKSAMARERLEEERKRKTPARRSACAGS